MSIYTILSEKYPNHFISFYDEVIRIFPIPLKGKQVLKTEFKLDGIKIEVYKDGLVS